jgi:hypothetical protein
MALLGSEARDDPDEERVVWQAVLLAQGAARLLVGVALEVDAVVDELDRRPDALLGVDLVHDGAADRDEPIHVERKAADLLAILDRADPR